MRKDDKSMNLFIPFLFKDNDVNKNARIVSVHLLWNFIVWWSGLLFIFETKKITRYWYGSNVKRHTDNRVVLRDWLIMSPNLIFPFVHFHLKKSPVCKYTVHERCVQRCMASCITTYSKKKTKGTPTFQHHWTEGNCYGRCSKCRKRIKAYHGITGLTCRWCRMTVSISVLLTLSLMCLFDLFWYYFYLWG